MIVIPRITKPDCTKDIPLTVLETNDETGYVKSYGSVFGVVDEQGEVVDTGAFAKAIERRKVRRVWQHDYKMPVGKLLSITEDNKGLLIETQYNLKTSWGHDAYHAVKHGDVDSFSIGYNEVKAKNYVDDEGIKHLGEVDLREVSDVTFPSNEHATTVEVKSTDTEPDETKAGRVLSGVNAQDITALRASLASAIEYCDAVLGRAAPKEAVEDKEPPAKSVESADEVEFIPAYTEEFKRRLQKLTELFPDK